MEYWDGMRKQHRPKVAFINRLSRMEKKLQGQSSSLGDAHVWDWDTDEGTRNRWLMVPRKLEKTRHLENIYMQTHLKRPTGT